LPQQWKKPTSVAVYKKGDKTDCNNYQGASLLSPSYEILCYILAFCIPMKLVWLIKMCLNETCSKVRIGKHLSDTFPIQTGLKQGDALSPLLFNFALEYVIRKVQENQVALKFNGTHRLLVNTDDVNLLGDNLNTIKNAQALIDASKEIYVEVNREN
jgi:hypothetical protein